jgi:hypothetical protein
MTIGVLEYKLKGSRLFRRRGEEARSDDITEQLRRVPRVADSVRLRTENERLREVLEYYAAECHGACCIGHDKFDPDKFDPGCGYRARAALAKQEKK